MAMTVYRVVIYAHPATTGGAPLLEAHEFLSLREARSFYEEHANYPRLKERHILRVRTESVQGELR